MQLHSILPQQKSQACQLWRLLLISGLLLFFLTINDNSGLKLSSGAAESPLPSLRNAEATEYLRQQGMYDSLAAAVAGTRYRVQADAKRTGEFIALNAAQELHARFTPQGLELRRHSNEQKPRLAIALSGVGYGERLLPVSPGVASAQGQRVEILRGIGGENQSAIGIKSRPRSTVLEWYVNRPDGLEQGFTLNEAPGKREAGEQLRLALALTGGMRARAKADGQAVEFTNELGGETWHYDHLAVWDARGQELAARMSVDDEKLQLEVDDSKAVYPITIDPIIGQQAYLKASNTGAGDSLGASIAVSGDTIVVGAPLEDSNAIGVNGDQTDNSAVNSGAAYVFTRSAGVWSQQAYLKASNTGADDRFGLSVAISGDTIVVGAFQEDSNATGVNGDQASNSSKDSGAAYVFVRSAGIWGQQAYLKASNTGTFDEFGWAIAMSGDTIVVGAIQESSNAAGVNGDQTDNSFTNSGAAYVFTRSAGVWSQQAYLKASNTGTADYFGNSVSISEDTLVVGASQEASNATGVNGNQADNTEPASGAVYVFTRNAGVWNQQAYLKASNTNQHDTFGSSVAVSGDTLVVGASQESSNATGVNGNQNNNSALESGAAYVFTRNAGVWSQQAYLKASNTDALDNFGVSVALSTDTIVIGAIGERSNATGVNGNQADNSATNSGAAYVFTRSGGIWSQRSYLKASNTDPFDQFGVAVGMSGNTIVVGASREGGNATGVGGDQTNNSASFSGAAYVFTISPLTGVSNSIVAADPLVCTGPGSVINGTATFTNDGNVSATVNASIALSNLVSTGVCTANVGVCTAAAGGSAINFTATLAAGQTATINYQTQLSGNGAPNVTGCSTLTVSSNNGPPTINQACTTANCPPVGPGTPLNSASPVSGQKAGSVLVYNVYTSSTDPTRQNTRINLTNTDLARPTAVHLFFVDGASCSVADSIVCLTQNQTISFLMSDLDPGTTGYLMAIAVNDNGCSRNFNYLIGDEYVKFASGHAANLGAEAISALTGGLPACDETSSTAVLAFDGVSYNAVPQTLAADDIPSRADGNDTMVILNRFGGNLGIGAATLGTLFGLLYDDTEKGVSFNISDGCQLRFSFSNQTPRTAPRFDSIIPAGRSGWAKFYSQGNIGMFGATINFNANSNAQANAFNQGHNLHKLTLNSAMTLIIPVFPPSC